MPELPEVETIKNDLAPLVMGRRFSRADLPWPGSVKIPSPSELQRRLPGQAILALSRRGKYLIFRLEGGLAPSPGSGQAPSFLSGQVLIVHLRMTGALLFQASPGPDDPYARAIFHFEDGARLLFSDKRKLGALWLVEREETVVGRLGPEPLEPGFTPQALGQRLARRSAPIKALLLDQELLAGVGNMYADEALFRAGIHPLRPAGSLSPEEVARLHAGIVESLIEAIGNRGATTSDYRTPDGGTGRHQLFFRVAHRGGEPCPRCATTIQRLKVRNRGTCFCPRCQA